MVKNHKFIFWLLGFVLMTVLGWGGTAALAANTPKPKLEVVKTAEVTKVDYAIKKYKGKDRLHVTVELKNVAKTPKRYRVNIWLPEGVAGGGFYPRKKKSIEPGKVLARTFPMYFSKMPTEVTISVKELPTD
jgi:hypothetical protein